MRFQNQTPYAALMFRASADERRMAASVAVRVAFAWSGDRFAPAEDQDWPVSRTPLATPYGEMPGDSLFLREGCDLFILGEARVPGGAAVSELDVGVEVGGFCAGVKVFGDRVWRRKGGSLAPSSPKPFTSMPLDLAHAYGGKADWDGLSVPAPGNPDGIGFYIDETAAEGARLPNIEDPARLIAKWDDRPLPAGTGPCPQGHPGRLLSATSGEPPDVELTAPARLNQAAYPAMVAPCVRAGDAVTVRGASARGDVTFQVPAPGMRVRIALGETVIERKLSVDQVGVEPGRGRIFVGYRYSFRYVLHARQVRSCALVADAA